METELAEEGDTSLICLVAKTACNCCVCAGLTYTDNDEIVVDARYYDADDFEDFVDGNILETALNAVDISDEWIAVNIDADYEDTQGKNVDITGAVGDGYHVWRFQPKFRPSYEMYGEDYRFSAGDVVKTFVWLQDYDTDYTTYETTITDTFYPSTSGSATEVTLMHAAQGLFYSVAGLSLLTAAAALF